MVSDARDPIGHMRSEEMPGTPARVLRHLVLFAFKESSTPQQIQALEKAFRDLPHKIGTIRAFEWGTDAGVENLSQGYSHCFQVTFLGERDRDVYLFHPVHQQFVSMLEPHLDKVLVLDYWAEV